MASELKRGWDTWDEGTLAESGERVLRGNLLTVITTKAIPGVWIT